MLLQTWIQKAAVCFSGMWASEQQAGPRSISGRCFLYSTVAQWTKKKTTKMEMCGGRKKWMCSRCGEMRWRSTMLFFLIYWFWLYWVVSFPFHVILYLHWRCLPHDHNGIDDKRAFPVSCVWREKLSITASAVALESHFPKILNASTTCSFLTWTLT